MLDGVMAKSFLVVKKLLLKYIVYHNNLKIVTEINAVDTGMNSVGVAWAVDLLAKLQAGSKYVGFHTWGDGQYASNLFQKNIQFDGGK